MPGDIRIIGREQTAPTVGTLTDRSGSVGATSAELLAVNPSREFFRVQNLHATAVLYVKRGGSAAVAGAAGTVRIGPGQMWTPNWVSTEAYQIISDTAATPYTCEEG
jgi:hypothetical protein